MRSSIGHNLFALYLLSIPSYFNFAYPGINKVFLIIGLFSLIFMRYKLTPHRLFISLLLFLLLILMSVDPTKSIRLGIYSVLIPLFPLIDSRDIKGTYNVFVVLFLISLIPSILLLLLFEVGLGNSIPARAIDVGRVFFIYPGTTLQPFDFATFSKLHFYKYSGIFGEPGGVGICSILILMAESFNIQTAKQKLVALSGLLSFSLAFYILFFIVIVVNIMKQPYKMRLKRIAIVVVCTIAIMITPLYRVLIQDRISRSRDVDSIEQIRVGSSTSSNDFSTFFFSQTQGNILFGHGNDASKQDEQPVLGTGVSYMLFLYNFGIIGFIFLFICIYAIFRFRLSREQSLLCLLILLFSFLQRPYIFDAWYFFLFFAISNNYSVTSNRNSHTFSKTNNEIVIYR